MSKRIRYVATKDPNVIVSVRDFINKNGHFYRVKINTEENTYRIISVAQQRVVRSTQKDGRKPPKTLKAVLAQVKKSLKSLGVNFEHEFRGL